MHQVYIQRSSDQISKCTCYCNNRLDSTQRQRDKYMYSIWYIAMFLYYLCCLMFRCLLFRRRLGVRLIGVQAQELKVIRIYVYQSMCLHYHPCTADVPLIETTFQNGAPDITRYCLKQHNMRIYLRKAWHTYMLVFINIIILRLQV